MNNTKKYKKHLKTTLKLFGGKKNKIANRFARKTFKKFGHNGGMNNTNHEYIFPASPTFHPLDSQQANKFFRTAAASEEASRLLGMEEVRVKIAREIANRRTELNNKNMEDLRKIRKNIMSDAREFQPKEDVKSWNIRKDTRKNELIEDLLRLEYEILPLMK